MVDEQAFRAKVKERMADVKAKGNDRLVAEQVIEEENIEKTDFIEFQAALNNRGVTRDRAQALWEELKQDGEFSDSDAKPPAAQKNRGDILLYREGAAGSETAFEALSGIAVSESDLTLIEVSSEDGRELAADLDGDEQLPVYISEVGGQRMPLPLEDLFREYL